MQWFLLWAWVAGITGTVVLLGIFLPLELVLQSLAVSQQSVNWLLTFLVLFWFIGSFFLTEWIDDRLSRRVPRIYLHLSGLLINVLLLTFFVLPEQGPLELFQSKTYTIAERFEFGPYPDEARMKQLKQRGFTGVISLLSPSIPFERVLLNREEERAQKHGLRLIKVPMVPWISANEKSLQKIRHLASSKTGRFYLHCYLGKHRVDLARNAILDTVEFDLERPEKPLPKTLERGPIYPLGPDLALGPLPTAEEWWSLQNVRVRSVVSLLEEGKDYGNSTEAESTLVESGIVDRRHRSVESIQEARTVVDALVDANVRTYIYDFRTPSWRLELIRRAFESKTERTVPGPFASLPASFERGPIEEVQPGVFVGPLPTSEEWYHHLVTAGVRSVLSQLDSGNPANQKWEDQVVRWSARTGVAYEHASAARDSLMAQINKLPKPLYIFDFRIDTTVDEYLRQHSLSGMFTEPRQPTSRKDSLSKASP